MNRAGLKHANRWWAASLLLLLSAAAWVGYAQNLADDTSPAASPASDRTDGGDRRVPAPAREPVEPADREPEAAPAIRFGWVDVMIDTGQRQLAAYQFDFRVKPKFRGRVAVVGLEGNAALPFDDPPVYDPRAMQGQRVIAASFTTAEADRLPHGRFRIARIHLQITGDAPVAFDIDLTAAVDHQGRDLPAKISIVEGTIP